MYLIPHIPEAYFFFYLLAVLIVFSSFLFQVLKLRYDPVAFLSLAAFAMTGMILGSKLFVLSSNEFLDFISGNAIAIGNRKTMIGALLGLSAGLLLGKSILKIKVPVLPLLIPSLPLAMAVQRVGCLFAGCCFGDTCTLPWSVRYEPGTAPYISHSTRGLIPENAAYSLAVHPTPLYEIAGCLAIFFLVFRLRKYFLHPNTSFYFSVTLYMVVRFVDELLRDHWSPGRITSGITPTGLFLISLVALGSLLVFSLERSMRTKSRSGISPEIIETKRKVVLNLLSVILLLIPFRMFSPSEVWTIRLLVVPSILFPLLREIWLQRQITFATVIPFILLIPVLMSQTIIPSKDTLVYPYSINTLSAGYSRGELEHYHSKISRVDMCGDPYEEMVDPHLHKFEIGKIGYTYTYRYNRRQDISLGLNFYDGKSREHSVGFSDWTEESIVGIYPNVGFNTGWFGAKLGLHLGNLGRTEDGDTAAFTTKGAFDFRVGPLKYLFFEYSQNLEEFGEAHSGKEAYFGSRFGTGDWMFRAGWVESGYCSRLMIPISRGFSIEPLILFSNGGNYLPAGNYFYGQAFFKFGFRK